jgi:Nucleotidyl transferase AbiEii toxin, Type IV TA system
MSLVPKFSALPEAQKALWPDLKQVPQRFVLYGGTALALRFEHRQSVDFDFFADAPVDPDALLREIPLLSGAQVLDKAANTLTVTVGRSGPVKLSFFGVRLRRVSDPELTQDRILRVASPLDVAACKMAAVQTRAEAKDYLDIYALLNSGIGLDEMLGAAQAVYGEQFAPHISLKALGWFGDGDLRDLPETIKQTLRQAANPAIRIKALRPLPGGVSPGAA